nr:MAG TPA: PemK-like protein [Caudoviricetes sp.]
MPRRLHMKARKEEPPIKRGDIFFIDRPLDAVASEQDKMRPGIIVSNDKNNAHSTNIEVVFLTSAYKKYLPTHVPICAAGRHSTALCENVQTVSTERFGSYIGRCSASEMRQIDRALKISLDLY